MRCSVFSAALRIQREQEVDEGADNSSTQVTNLRLTGDCGLQSLRLGPIQNPISNTHSFHPTHTHTSITWALSTVHSNHVSEAAAGHRHGQRGGRRRELHQLDEQLLGPRVWGPRRQGEEGELQETGQVPHRPTGVSTLRGNHTK